MRLTEFSSSRTQWHKHNQYLRKTKFAFTESINLKHVISGTTPQMARFRPTLLAGAKVL
ncbi:MAG: hypothetical protein M0Z50_06125 [Planctomycetia bacterium]|jgi:hypothetical protein|nr:hypothetical protein [Planctomycetia bacterium]